MGCHAECAKYKAFRASMDEARKERNKYIEADDLRAKNITRLKRKHGGEHTR